MGSSVVIGAEGPTTPLAMVVAQNFAAAAEDYLVRYPDVKAAYGENYNAAHLHYISNGQNAVKVGNSDILFVLYLPNGQTLLNTFHHGESNIVRGINLPEPIDIEPAGAIWIWADGWGDASPGGIEVQTGLYFYGN